MSNYTALYRKYRPKTFNDVYGQDAIVQTLKNEVKLNRLGHAYLFCGPRGTGKTSIAKIFSKAINCENPIDGNPCGQCSCCKLFDDKLNTDIVEIDAASNNGVDNIRDLIDESKYMPQHGANKVYIIDEVHMLSTSAFNALLKTLEEPSKNTIFILATTEENKVLSTIVSRCQKFMFKLIPNNTIVDALKDILNKENIQYEEEALKHISKLAKGGLRDALSLTDQCINYQSNIRLDLIKDIFGEIEEEDVNQMTYFIENNKVGDLLDIAQNIYMNGKQISHICSSLYNHYRELCFKNTDNMIYQRYMTIFGEVQEKIKYATNPYTVFEIELIRACTPQMEESYNALYQRVMELENKIQSISIDNFNVNVNSDEFITIIRKPCTKKKIEVYYI